MSRKGVISLGPSLSAEQLVQAFPGRDFSFLSNVKEVPVTESYDRIFIVPPIVSGDLFYLSQTVPSAMIGIVDGFFENLPSVWHKEILYSLSQNIPVCGAASMGALRASELSDFGMKGVGQIYHRFKQGIYEDDDEVAVHHGPKELGYPSISDAMVNIRSTLELAHSQNVIGKDSYDGLISLSKSLFYKDRKWDYILSQYQIKNPNIIDHSAFKNWIRFNQINQKRLDAIELVNVLIHHREDKFIEDTDYSFHNSSIWRKFIHA